MKSRGRKTCRKCGQEGLGVRLHFCPNCGAGFIIKEIQQPDVPLEQLQLQSTRNKTNKKSQQIQTPQTVTETPPAQAEETIAKEEAVNQISTEAVG